MKRVEMTVMKEYHVDLTNLVISKLKNIVKTLDFNTYRKSIAIYVSPVFEKVLYSDVEVEEKINVDESFEIRNIVWARKEMNSYLLLTLISKKANVYVSNEKKLVKIKSNVPDHIIMTEYDKVENTGNFQDTSQRKGVILKKILYCIDQGLSYLLTIHQVPVFVTGTKKEMEYFKSISKNVNAIHGYVYGNFEQSSLTNMQALLQPCLQDWQKVKEESLLRRLESAADKG